MKKSASIRQRSWAWIGRQLLIGCVIGCAIVGAVHVVTFVIAEYVIAEMRKP